MSADGATAVVTGGGRGLGLAIAEALGRDGHHALIVGRDRERLEHAVAHLEASGVVAEWRLCDLADRSSLAELITELAERPGIKVLVNNAGNADLVSVGDTSERYWDSVIEVNLTAAFLLARGLAGALQTTGGGAILNVGSSMGIGTTAGLAAYSAAKAGLHHLTRALAIELGPRGVRTNAIAPGFVHTDLFERHHPPVRRLALAKAHPLGRVADPAEIGAVAAFLCSDGASFVNGAVIPVDGGLTAQLAIPDLLDGS